MTSTPIFNPYAKEMPYSDVPLLDNEFDSLDDLRPGSFHKINSL